MDGERPQDLLQRVERARRVVSLCSQVIIRAYDEAALLAEECRILIDVGGYAMAWVGEARDPRGPLTALAHAAIEATGVRAVPPPWAKGLGPHTPMARAIREQRPQVVRNIPGNPDLARRHPEAEAMGYSAFCAFPLQFGPHGAGALAVYAREPDAFEPEEVALLRELAGDLAVGVAVLRAKHANDILEEQLEAAERRFRNLIDHAPVAVLQVSLTGQVLIANQTLANLLGYRNAAEVMAQPSEALARHVEEADRERILNLLRAGPPYRALELRARRRDDTFVWVDVLVQPGIGIGERVIEAFVRDLTAVRAVQLASARLAAVVDSSEEAIIGIDAKGVIQNWSRGAVALYGYSEAEALGRPLVEVCVPLDRKAEWDGIMATLAAGRRVHRFETQRLCKQLDLKDVSVAASPIMDADGTVVGASLIEHDVGERHRAETARLAHERQQQEVFHLQELSRIRADFMGRASHELNTPLTPVLLQLQSLKEMPGLDAKQVLGLASIERNVLRLAVLVKDLMVASTLNSNRLDLRPGEVDLRELASDAVASFQSQALRQEVLLRASGTQGVPAFADRDRIVQVLFNLLGNALKYTPKGGRVTVETALQDGEPTVTVTDTGLGFPAKRHGDLFRPFGRLHEEIEGTPPGTGLGLFISKGILEASGGRIWAISKGPGKGATFGFALPAKPVARPGRGIVAAKGFTDPAAEEARDAPVTPVVVMEQKASPSPPQGPPHPEGSPPQEAAGAAKPSGPVHPAVPAHAATERTRSR
ncbi:MAG TPA: PAS domain S-box protein [Candidatus Thermoplasmatota archaeon]|nr:PAS domain S-box protein [Candidatus Thermoplasmatota archaeon]